MIIDCILDRKNREADVAMGFTHVRMFDGKIKPLAYNAHDFYMDIFGYGEIADDITLAMDYGTEEDVKNALCDYVLQNGYNPAICDFIRSVEWLPAEI